MKRSAQIILLLFAAFYIYACAPAAAPTEGANKSEPQPTPSEKYHSLDTRLGITEIDVVLAAVESGEGQQLRDLFHFAKLACRTVKALGGPPSCREGEAEGTIVEVLPSRGPEGSFLRKDEAGNWPSLDVTGSYTVYRVSDSASADEDYPAGDYGIIFIREENSPNFVLQVTNDGIVRIDYIFDHSPTALTETLARDASEVILAPIH